MNKKYGEFIRSLVCIKCGKSKSHVPMEAAHIRLGSLAGTGRKPLDSRVVPMCKMHHDIQHSIGELAFHDDLNKSIKLASEIHDSYHRHNAIDRRRNSALIAIQRFRNDLSD